MPSLLKYTKGPCRNSATLVRLVESNDYDSSHLRAAFPGHHLCCYLFGIGPDEIYHPEEVAQEAEVSDRWLLSQRSEVESRKGPASAARQVEVRADAVPPAGPLAQGSEAGQQTSRIRALP